MLFLTRHAPHALQTTCYKIYESLRSAPVFAEPLELDQMYFSESVRFNLT